MVWIVLGIIVIGVVAWWLLRPRKSANHATPAPRRGSTASPNGKSKVPARRTWGGKLVIPPGANACPMARKLEGRYYKNGKAPAIPLPGCGLANCQCQLEPQADRRFTKERRSGKERRPQLRFEPGKTDRRAGDDRREDNRNPFATEIQRD
jgi:hypothetical protein